MVLEGTHRSAAQVSCTSQLHGSAAQVSCTGTSFSPLLLHPVPFFAPIRRALYSSCLQCIAEPCRTSQNLAEPRSLTVHSPFIHSSFWGYGVCSCVGLLSVLAVFFLSGLLSGALSALFHGRSGCYGEQWRHVVDGRRETGKGWTSEGIDGMVVLICGSHHRLRQR